MNTQDEVVELARTVPGYAEMLMEDAVERSRQEQEERDLERSIASIAHTLEPDPVYVAARAVVTEFAARPYDGVRVSRAIAALARALSTAGSESE